jgi:hypothetical protein
MDYWICYSLLLTYYILGFILFFYITSKKTKAYKYEEYKKGDVNNDLTHELLMEATF